MGAYRPQIVLFGDSHTEFSFLTGGWGAALANHYSRKADVVCRGHSGYNTRWASFILDRVFPIPTVTPPLLAIVFLGSNDSADPNAGHRMLHVPLQEYKENLHRIVSHIKTQSASTKNVLLTPPPVDEETLLATGPAMGGFPSEVTSCTNAVLKQYAEECLKVAEEEGLCAIDLGSKFQETLNWKEKFFRDGLHFSTEGSDKLFELLLKILDDTRSVPTLIPDDMPWDSPVQEILQSKNPAAIFNKQ